MPNRQIKGGNKKRTRTSWCRKVRSHPVVEPSREEIFENEDVWMPPSKTNYFVIFRNLLHTLVWKWESILISKFRFCDFSLWLQKISELKQINKNFFLCKIWTLTFERNSGLFCEKWHHDDHWRVAWMLKTISLDLYTYSRCRAPKLNAAVRMNIPDVGGLWSK